MDSVPAPPAADGPLLQLPIAQAGWRNILNICLREVFTDLNGPPVLTIDIECQSTHHALRVDHLGEGVREVLQRDLSRVVDVLEELDVRHVPLLVKQLVEPRQVLNRNGCICRKITNKSVSVIL